MDQQFPSTEMARKAVDQAVKIYNSKRLHVSLGYKTPDDVFMSVA
ncbi:MAG: integrase core domain-containing protein [Bacteroidota bacterium]